MVVSHLHGDEAIFHHFVKAGRVAKVALGEAEVVGEVGIIIFFAVKVKLIVKLLLQLVTLPLKEHIDPVHEVSFLLFSDTEPKSVKDDVLHLLTRCLFQQRSFHDCLVRLQEAKVQNDAALKSDRGRTQKVKPREKWKGSA